MYTEYVVLILYGISAHEFLKSDHPGHLNIWKKCILVNGAGCNIICSAERFSFSDHY